MFSEFAVHKKFESIGTVYVTSFSEDGLICATDDNWLTHFSSAVGLVMR